MNSKSILISFLLSVVSVVVYHFLSYEKTVYVDLFEVYDNYDMNKELNNEIQKYSEDQKLKLDQTFLASEDSTNIELRKRMYQNRLQNLQNELERKSEENRATVLENISAKIKDFSKEKGYDMVLGANGTGNLLYAKEHTDITKDFTTYLNDIYNDK